jgi:hypothetical protein
MLHKTKQLKWGEVTSKFPSMTFILGARCIDGVVLVADRKITRTNEFGSTSFEYKENYMEN